MISEQGRGRGVDREPIEDQSLAERVVADQAARGYGKCKGDVATLMAGRHRPQSVPRTGQVAYRTFVYTCRAWRLEI